MPRCLCLEMDFASLGSCGVNGLISTNRPKAATASSPVPRSGFGALPGVEQPSPGLCAYPSSRLGPRRIVVSDHTVGASVCFYAGTRRTGRKRGNS